MQPAKALSGFCFALLLSLASVVVCAADPEPEPSSESLLDALSSGAKAVNKVSDKLINKMSGASHVGSKLLKGKAPGFVAVLPASGEGSAQEHSEIRVALHNNLGSTNIQSLKPAEVDRLLLAAAASLGVAWEKIPQDQLCELLGVDGIMLVTVDEIDRLYAGAYAHYEVGISVRLYSQDAGGYIWEKTDKESERKGGVSINPLGMLATAITSAQVLSDAVRQVLVNTIARRVAKDIPQPRSFLRRKKPINFDLAVSNAVEGPFAAGDEIKVIVQAEAGLVMFFSISGVAEPVQMIEKEKGEYLGVYSVPPVGGANNLFVSVQATRVKDKQQLQWRVPGKLTIDTTAPGAIHNFTLSPVSRGIRLHWQPPLNEDSAGIVYQLEKASLSDGVYSSLGEVAITEYLDATAEAGIAYYYRVRPVDAAKNQGPALSEKVFAAKPGPTYIGGLLEGEVFLPAVGNPYRLKADLLLPATSVLRVEPGVVFELTTGQKIQAQGALILSGTADRPVVFRGQHWEVTLDGAASEDSLFEYVHFNGKGSQLRLQGSRVKIAHARFDGVGISLHEHARLQVDDSFFFKADTALALHSGSVVLNRVGFSGNDRAIVLDDLSGRATLETRKLRFEDNRLHLSSNTPMTLSDVTFVGADMDAVLAALEGPVSVDWSSVENGQHLLGQWLKTRLLSLQKALREKKYASASALLSELGVVVDTDSIGNFQQVLAGSSSQSTYWLHRETLLTSQLGGQDFNVRLLRKKFGEAYLKRELPELKRSQRAKILRAASLTEGLMKTHYVMSRDRGIMTDVLVAHELDISRVQALLRASGANSGSASRHTLALDIENSALSNTLLDVLSSQNFRYSLKTNKASKYKLSSRVTLRQSGSQISENIRVVDVTLRLQLEDLATGELLKSWKSVGSASAFGGADAERKAVDKALAKVQATILRKLWQLDSLPSKTVMSAKSKTKVKPKPKSKPKVVAEAKPAVVAEAVPAVIAEAVPAVVAEAEPAVVAEAVPAVIAEAEPAVVAEAKPAVIAEAELEVVAEAVPAVVAEAGPAVVVEAESDVVAETKPAVVAETEREVVAEDASELVKSEFVGAPVAGPMMDP